MIASLGVRFDVLRPWLLAALLLGTATAHAAAYAADDDLQLGDAPQRHESQDTSGWAAAPSRKAALAVQTRADVVQLYEAAYVPGDAVALTWSGAIAACDPGTTDLTHQQAVIGRVNYARALAGLPAVTLLGNPQTTQAQAASLMMSANNQLSHSPPVDWLCYSSEGAAGAGNSNLALGAFGVDAIDLYLDDPGPGNSATGHRRWVLFPPRAAMATGDIPRTGTTNDAANDLYVFGPSTTRPATPSGIAWPPAGFVPYQNLPMMSNRWSFSYPGADFSAAMVTMSGPGGPIPVTLEPLASGFGDNTIVFRPASASSLKAEDDHTVAVRPTSVSYLKPEADTDYTIAVSGIKGNGVPTTVEYTVTVIDPDPSPPPAASNYQGLWWASPPGSESGWGINFAHQGDVIFATWFTYDLDGRPWWLAVVASRVSPGVYTGELFTTAGPPFDAVPFDPATVVETTVGTATFTFTDNDHATFTYTVSVNDPAKSAVTQTKTITRQQFGTLPTCVWGEQPNLGLATNFQDLWWNSPPGSESGWGINLTHQDDVIFATWFTYDANGVPWWPAFVATRTAPGVYEGDIFTTTGPPFNAVPFNSNAVVESIVGKATLTFLDGKHAAFVYTVSNAGVVTQQTKQLARQVFAAPGTVCQ